MRQSRCCLGTCILHTAHVSCCLSTSLLPTAHARCCLSTSLLPTAHVGCCLSTSLLPTAHARCCLSTSLLPTAHVGCCLSTSLLSTAHALCMGRGDGREWARGGCRGGAHKDVMFYSTRTRRVKTTPLSQHRQWPYSCVHVHSVLLFLPFEEVKLSRRL